MSFDSQNLGVVAYANGFTLWHYSTQDTAADVTARGYFNTSANMLHVGDMIIATIGGNNKSAAIYWVNANTENTVSIADITTGQKKKNVGPFRNSL